jgi:hypothetical protein
VKHGDAQVDVGIDAASKMFFNNDRSFRVLVDECTKVAKGGGKSKEGRVLIVLCGGRRLETWPTVSTVGSRKTARF